MIAQLGKQLDHVHRDNLLMSRNGAYERRHLMPV
jgi:hypothetical protein